MMQMQLEMYHRCAAMPKDADGYPRLMICPVTGVVKIAHNKRDARTHHIVTVVGVVLGLTVAPLILWWLI